MQWNHRCTSVPPPAHSWEAEQATRVEQPHSYANQILNFMAFMPTRCQENENYAKLDENLQPTASPRHVGESRQVQLVRDGHSLRRAVTVFGENEIRLSPARVVALERIGPVQQDDDVGILF
jgi:hypothetical protein